MISLEYHPINQMQFATGKSRFAYLTGAQILVGILDPGIREGKNRIIVIPIIRYSLRSKKQKKEYVVEFSIQTAGLRHKRGEID